MVKTENFSGYSRQRGMALITAMLVVAIAVTTASYISLDQQIWLRQAENLTDRAQAEVVRAGVLDWTVTMLTKDARESNSDNLTENWAKTLPPLPVEGGQITGQISDAQARFNINNLVRNNAPSAPDIGTFQNLLKSLAIDPNITDAAIDWIDADGDARPYGAEDIEYLQLEIPYRAANQPLQSIEELRLIRGITPEIFEKLQPWVTALPQPTEINVNTASKEVLSALFYTFPVAVIDQIIEKRPHKDVAQLTKTLQEQAKGGNIPQAYYGISSSYFEVNIQTLFGRYSRTTQALIQRTAGGGPAQVLWHRQRLPTKIVAGSTNTTESSGKQPM